jgi:hypothetical protein
MSRVFRLCMLVSVAPVIGGCAPSPTAPVASSQPAANAPKQAPLKASRDGTCDWISPWTKC